MKGFQPVRKDEEDRKPAGPSASVPVSPTSVTA